MLRAGEPTSKISDTLILTSDQRRARHGRVTSARSVEMDFDLPEDSPEILRTDDVLMLDNGEFVDVVAAPEPLVEVRGEHEVLARVAWAIGDRHVPAQFLPNRIRLREDASLRTLIRNIGGKVTAIEAPFEPEGGAYSAHGHHDPGHHHSHHHDHTHKHS